VVDREALAEAVGPGVSVVSVMLVNNEVGTIQPVAEVAEMVRRRAPEAVVHTDAVAAVPWLDLAEAAREADLVSISAHKFGGPKGVGALVVRRGTALGPVLHGGAQETGRRPGTHDVAGIVGMAAAFSAAMTGRRAEVARVAGAVGSPDGVPVVMSDAAWADYRVTGYPFFVLVDAAQGVIVGETVAFGWSDVRALIEASGH